MAPGEANLGHARVLIRVTLETGGIGLLAALIAILVILVGATTGGKAIPAAEVWIRWRERVFLWICSLSGCLLAAAVTSVALAQVEARHDLFWSVETRRLLLTSLAATGFGFLTGMLLFALWAMAARRRGQRRPNR